MTRFEFDTIFTLEARSNVRLEVMADHFELSDERIFADIQKTFGWLKSTLDSKGISYSDLQRALVPSPDRSECAYVFDWTKFEGAAYGREAMDKLLPLLHQKSTHSVLCGDWLGDGDFSEWVKWSPQASVAPDLVSAAGKGGSLYFVYVNNLSSSMPRRLHEQLRGFAPYLGYLDLTFASPLKGYLSTLLVRAFIKHRNLVILGHEDDRPDHENFNLSLFDFDGVGLAVRSVPLLLYELFLSYKIERLTLERERDTGFSLNAIGVSSRQLSDCEIVIDDAKLKYLRTEKSGSLKRAGLAGLAVDEVEDRIRHKIQSSYIYNLARSKNGETLKFNIIMELTDAVRSLCALEYRVNDHTLRLVTFY